MIEGNNKSMEGKEVKTKAEKQEQEFHFAGGGQHPPRTIKATSRAEAEAKWHEGNKKVESIKSNNK